MKKALIIFIMLFFCSICFADRGMIPINPGVRIFEPYQRAMITWNGSEEILLLSTDLSASDSTMVLEVLPLPSEPEVKKGDIETFRRAINLINRRLAVGFQKNGSGRTETVIPPPGEVTFYKKIGPHDISVTHLLDSKGFVDWVKNYLKSLGFGKDVLSDEMKNLVEEYIKDDFVWFVFDVVSLNIETVTNEPVQYRFKTKSLFYPLRITKTGEGYTSIELLVLTPHLLQTFPDLPMERVELRHKPIAISNDELKELNEDICGLLGKEPEIKLRIWRIEGNIKTFDKDLIAR